MSKKIDYKRQGKNNKRKGRRKQYEAMRQLSIHEPKLQYLRAHEEGWKDGFMRVEVKAGKQVQTLWNRYLKAKEQSDTNLPDDERPFVFVAKPDGTSDGLVIFAMSDLDEFYSAYSMQIAGKKFTETGRYLQQLKQREEEE